MWSFGTAVEISGLNDLMCRSYVFYCQSTEMSGVVYKPVFIEQSLVGYMDPSTCAGATPNNISYHFKWALKQAVETIISVPSYAHRAGNMLSTLDRVFIYALLSYWEILTGVVLPVELLNSESRENLYQKNVNVTSQ